MVIPSQHCKISGVSLAQRIFAFYLMIFLMQDPAIRPRVAGWLDDGSGISKFSFQVFFMQPDAYGILSPNGNPYPDSVATLSASAIDNYQFTVPAPGVYSIIVTAYDYANNSAQARKIFNYIDGPSYTTDSSKQVYLQEANANVNYSFITQLTNPLQVTLVWTGRFIPTTQWLNVFSARVNPLGASNGYTIDDIYGTQFGQRSIASHENRTGISSYTVSWYVDQTQGGIYVVRPDIADNSTTKTVTTESTTIDLLQPLTSGSTIVVWLTANGVTSHNTTYRLVTRVDLSPPNITTENFMKNGGSDGYFSRLVMTPFSEIFKKLFSYRSQVRCLTFLLQLLVIASSLSSGEWNVTHPSPLTGQRSPD